MGRPFFSQRYVTVEPSIRTEPEPKVDICEPWSISNRFDPDSEDFFRNAEYEAFIHSAELEQDEIPELLSPVDAVSNSDTSSDGDVSEQRIPMAVGLEDPVMLVRGTYNTTSTARWQAAGETSEPSWAPDAMSPSINTDIDNGNDALPIPNRQLSTSSQSRPTDQLGNPAFIPPAVFRATSPDNGELERPLSRRTVDTIPIAISNVRPTTTVSTASSNPASAGPSPSTPPSQRATVTPVRVQTLYTPSPPSSVTPRTYSWQHHPIPVMPTPTRFSYGTGAIFTNPRARISNRVL